MYGGASYILYGAAHICMVRAVLYCTVLRAFSHFHAIYRCFPYSCTLCKPHSQLKIDPTPTSYPRHRCTVPDLRITHHMCKCAKKPSAESHKCNALNSSTGNKCAQPLAVEYYIICASIASRGTVGGRARAASAAACYQNPEK